MDTELALQKSIQPATTKYNGTKSYILPAGSKIKFKLKLPDDGWNEILDTEVPKDTQWNFIITLAAHESDV